MPRGFQQPVGSDDVGFYEGFGAGNRPIDVALGGKVQDRTRLVSGEDRIDSRTIANIAAFQDVARMIGEHLERFEIGGISELIDIDDESARRTDQMPADSRADEPRTACDEYAHVIAS